MIPEGEEDPKRGDPIVKSLSTSCCKVTFKSLEGNISLGSPFLDPPLADGEQLGRGQMGSTLMGPQQR